MACSHKHQEFRCKQLENDIIRIYAYLLEYGIWLNRNIYQIKWFEIVSVCVCVCVCGGGGGGGGGGGIPYHNTWGHEKQEEDDIMLLVQLQFQIITNQQIISEIKNSKVLWCQVKNYFINRLNYNCSYGE